MNIPPVNLGGQIPYGGSILWDDRARELRDVRFVRWGMREPTTAFFSPIDGQSGLLLVHLRFDDAERVAHLGRLVARWETAIGATGTTGVATRSTYRFGRCGQS